MMVAAGNVATKERGLPMPDVRERFPFDRACKGKFYYASRAEAKLAIRGMRRGGPPENTGDGAANVKPYRCPHCDRWHVGHRPGTDARVRKMLDRRDMQESADA